MGSRDHLVDKIIIDKNGYQRRVKVLPNGGAPSGVHPLANIVLPPRTAQDRLRSLAGRATIEDFASEYRNDPEAGKEVLAALIAADYPVNEEHEKQAAMTYDYILNGQLAHQYRDSIWSALNYVDQTSANSMEVMLDCYFEDRTEEERDACATHLAERLEGQDSDWIQLELTNEEVFAWKRSDGQGYWVTSPHYTAPAVESDVGERPRPESIPGIPQSEMDKVFRELPETRNEVWDYASKVASEWGYETEDREHIWSALVAHRNPDWVVGLSEQYRLRGR